MWNCALLRLTIDTIGAHDDPMTQAAFLLCRTPGWLAVVSCPPVLFHFEEDVVFPLASSRVCGDLGETDGSWCHYQ